MPSQYDQRPRPEPAVTGMAYLVDNCNLAVPEDVEFLPYVVSCVNALAGLSPEGVGAVVEALEELAFAVDPSRGEDEVQTIEPYFRKPLAQARQALSAIRGEVTDEA